MGKLTTKDITKISLLSAVIGVASYLLIMQFVFIVIVRSVKRSHAYLIALCSSLITFVFWGFVPSTLLNFVILPVIAFLLYEFESFIDGPNKNNSAQQVRINLTVVSFIVILLANFLNSAILGQLFVGSALSYFILYFASNVGFAIINAVLVYFLAAPVKAILDQLVERVQRNIH